MSAAALLLLAALAATPDARASEAAALYEEGARHYQVEEYDAAIDAFKRSYLRSADPGLLYNIAQAFRMKGDGFCRDALRYYRTYLEQKPKAADRPAVEALISKMKTCAEREREPAPTPPLVVVEAPVPPPPAPVATPELPPPPAPAGAVQVTAPPPTPVAAGGPLALGLGGLAVGLTGAGLQIAARGRFEQLKAQCPCGPETWEGWRSAETVSWFLMVGGGAASLAGLIWAVVPPPEPKPTPQVVIAVDPSGFSVRGRF